MRHDDVGLGDPDIHQPPLEGAIGDRARHREVAASGVDHHIGELAAGELAEAHALLGRSHEVRGCVVAGGERQATDEPSRFLLEIPGEILLPPAGDYLGSLLADDGTAITPVRILLPERAAGDLQRFEILLAEASAASPLFATGTGKVVRVRFG